MPVEQRGRVIAVELGPTGSNREEPEISAEGGSLAALRQNRVTAPFVLEGAMTGEIFRAYVKQFLAPTLKRGDIVFMDNASVHKVIGIEEAIEAKGAIL